MLRLEQEPPDAPLALLAAGPRAVLAECNDAARANGVAPGLTVPQALARCPRLGVRAPHPAAETDARAALLAPTRQTRKDDIWCDDPKSFLYNRHLRGPTRLSHEDLWRSDRLYDFVGVLDHNIRPAMRGRGSAIFFHVATEDLAPTAGCVARRRRPARRTG